MPQELGTTTDGTVIGFRDRELHDRWNEIAEALANAAIAPDPLTLAATCDGTLSHRPINRSAHFTAALRTQPTSLRIPRDSTPALNCHETLPDIARSSRRNRWRSSES